MSRGSWAANDHVYASAGAPCWQARVKARTSNASAANPQATLVKYGRGYDAHIVCSDDGGKSWLPDIKT